MPLVREHAFEFDVRYYETDAQGHVHHSNYIRYFELGRIELLRAGGRSYLELENEGRMLVVARMACRYFFPCKYGDTLRLVTRAEETKGASIRHTYKLYRGDTLVADGESTIACVDREGRIRRLPDWLRLEAADAEQAEGL